MDNNLLYRVTICAVIFGADETLFNINLGNDFTFERMSLIPSKNHLDKVFQTNEIGLRREYETARINENHDVICAIKSYKIKLKRTEAEEHYRKTCDDVLKYLDDGIRVIRLFVEGPVRFKKLSINMKSETVLLGGTKVSSNFSNIIPIGEAMITSAISEFHCEDEKTDELNKNITLVRFPLLDAQLNNCHRYYDLSYHQDRFISITLLITCLEILFLISENAKKEKLAKRCSVFLYENKNERLNCYNKLLKAYKMRSDFVHDGNCSQIKDEDILFLRDCVRRSLQKCLNNQFSKKDIIKELKKIIENLDYWNEKNQ